MEVTLDVMQSDLHSNIPQCIYWPTERLMRWFNEIGHKQYMDCIRKNFICGRHLILLDASKLPKIGIYDFKHIIDIAGKIRILLRLKEPVNWKEAIYDPYIAYLMLRTGTGMHIRDVSYKNFVFTNRAKLFIKGDIADVRQSESEFLLSITPLKHPRVEEVKESGH